MKILRKKVGHKSPTLIKSKIPIIIVTLILLTLVAVGGFIYTSKYLGIDLPFISQLSEKNDSQATNEPEKTSIPQEVTSSSDKKNNEDIANRVDSYGNPIPTLSPNIPEKEVDISKISKNYYVMLEEDINWLIDLNGERIKDKIAYCNYTKEVDGVTESDGTYIYLNEIGYNIYSAECPAGFGIIDLDSSDNEYEIFTEDEGPSGDPHTSFLFYVENKLLGNEPDDYRCMDQFISDDSYKINLDNTPGLLQHKTEVYTITNTYINETCTYDSKTHSFKIDGCNEYDIVSFCGNYYDDNQEGYAVLQKELKAYAESNFNFKSITLKPQKLKLKKVIFLDDGNDEIDYYFCDKLLCLECEDGSLA